MMQNEVGSVLRPACYQAKRQTKDSPSDLSVIFCFQADPKLLPHEEHGCHEQALQCRVLHPVKYAQLSAKLSEQHKYSVWDCTLMSVNIKKPHKGTRMHTPPHTHTQMITLTHFLHHVTRHRKWDWLVLCPMPRHYNWITHKFSVHPFILCTQSHLSKHTFIHKSYSDNCISFCVNLPHISCLIGFVLLSRWKMTFFFISAEAFVANCMRRQRGKTVKSVCFVLESSSIYVLFMAIDL